MSDLTAPRETKKEKFIRLAEQRVNQILEQLRKLGNLSNKRNYEYDDSDIKKIFSELNKELKKAKGQFANNGIETSKRFKL